MMVDLQQLWSDAKATDIVCSKTGATKNMILCAMMDKNAHDFEAMAKEINLCGTDSCAYKNISGHSCRENVEAIIAYYLPVYQMMCEHKCHHKKQNKQTKYYIFMLLYAVG